MELHGDESLPYWRRAYDLAMVGEYLPEEVFTDWTEARRVVVMGALRQSVHALCHRYIMQYGTQGHAEAMRILQHYLSEYLVDEDALRVLMELFGAQERFQEAEAWFYRTKRAVEADGEHWMRARWMCGDTSKGNRFIVVCVTNSLCIRSHL
jgi:hypothetical protein